RIELDLIGPARARGIAEFTHFGELFASQRTTPDCPQRGLVLRLVCQRIEHAAAHARPHTKYALELIACCPIDSQPAIVPVADLDEGIRAFKQIGENLSFRERLGYALLQSLVQ